MLSDHLDRLSDDVMDYPFRQPMGVKQEDDDSAYRSAHRRTTSSLDKVRTWKKYKNKKHLSQLELDR